MRLLKLLSMGGLCGSVALAPACNGTSSGNDLPKTLMKFDGYTNPAWSFDGSVFTAQSTEDGGIYVLDEDGDASLLVAEADHARWLSGALVFSFTRPVGDEDDGEREYVLLDYETREETVLSGLDSVCGHAWSPDGRKLVTTVRSEEQDGLRPPRSELRVVDLEGKELFLSDAIAGDRKCSPDWSPDGKYIYFASKTPGGEYYDHEPVTVLHVNDDFVSEVVEDGSESRSTAISSTFDDWFYVAFTGRESSHHAICARSIQGRQAECQTADEGIAQDGAWSPVHPILAVTVGAPDNQLYVFDVTTERKAVIYESIEEPCGDCDSNEPGIRLDSPTWSADGRQLAYTVREGDDTSVHVIDVQPWLDELDE